MFIIFFKVSKCFRNVSSEQSLKLKEMTERESTFYKGINHACNGTDLERHV